ncbi:unnamed protein product [Haemonchus placei]|uniref:Transcriptional regulator n=1 Tax=Haemonchus placei TaxID=6290 RepID=A0A0N4XBZ7_HAEPC|nr:unnamed protein product [Haemonchus placei]
MSIERLHLFQNNAGVVSIPDQQTELKSPAAPQAPSMTGDHYEARIKREDDWEPPMNFGPWMARGFFGFKKPKA